MSVDGAPATTPARQVAPSESIRLAHPAARFVGRGGRKLDAAIERFAVPVQGRRALDIGASTGGFTDCLLQRGAAEVVALDVGRAQLHERLRQDPRVVVRERTNIRTADPVALGGPFPLVVADLSFISLRTVAASVLGCAADGADLVVLVKPQFEAERHEAAAGRGVIADPEVWRRTLVHAAAALSGAGAAIMAAMVSPLRGADGNVEFFLHLQRGAATGDPPPGALFDPDPAVAEARRLVGGAGGPR